MVSQYWDANALTEENIIDAEIARQEDKFHFLNSLMSLKLRHPTSKIIMGGDFNMIKSLSIRKIICSNYG